MSFPGVDFAAEPIWVVYSAVEALAAEHADLDLDHVEPAGMLGGVVEFQALQNAAGFGGRECFIEREPAEWVDRLSCTTRMQAASG